MDTEEFWDDSALIKAYEKAVNSFKVSITDQCTAAEDVVYAIGRRYAGRVY